MRLLLNAIQLPPTSPLPSAVKTTTTTTTTTTAAAAAAATAVAKDNQMEI